MCLDSHQETGELPVPSKRQAMDRDLSVSSENMCPGSLGRARELRLAVGAKNQKACCFWISYRKERVSGQELKLRRCGGERLVSGMEGFLRFLSWVLVFPVITLPALYTLTLLCPPFLPEKVVVLLRRLACARVVTDL